MRAISCGRCKEGSLALAHLLLRRAETATAKTGKPRRFVFAFNPPAKTFQLRMSFKKGRVEKAEIIEALENIIRELRAAR